MTKERAIELIKNEIKCASNICNRDCHICPLGVNEKEIIEAFLMAIEAIETSKIFYDKAELKQIVATQIKKVI